MEFQRDCIRWSSGRVVPESCGGGRDDPERADEAGEGDGSAGGCIASRVRMNRPKLTLSAGRIGSSFWQHRSRSDRKTLSRSCWFLYRFLRFVGDVDEHILGHQLYLHQPRLPKRSIPDFSLPVTNGFTEAKLEFRDPAMVAVGSFGRRDVIGSSLPSQPTSPLTSAWRRCVVEGNVAVRH